MKCGNPGKQRGWGGGLGGGAGSKGYEMSFGGRQKVLEFHSGDGCTTLWIHKNPLNGTL